MERDTFRNLLVTSSSESKASYIEFLKKVEVLSHLSAAERAQISDVTKSARA